MYWIDLGSTIILGVLFLSGYIKTGKPYQLLYLLFWAYLCIGAPILEKITSNNIIESVYMFFGIISMLIFTYWDIMKTKKEN